MWFRVEKKLVQDTHTHTHLLGHCGACRLALNANPAQHLCARHQLLHLIGFDLI